MSRPYRIFGSEMSPYSVKVRSYFRLKQIPHVWVPRGPDNNEEYGRYARLPIIPTVVTPDDEGLQDSTPIIERLEGVFAEPSIHPPDPALRFLSELIEEFADEWGNKLMFHHRWFAEVDIEASAQTLARLSSPHGDADAVAGRPRAIRERMTGRGHFVGSSVENAPLITTYYLELVDLLEAHLAGRRYLFGARPAFADFGLAGQLYETSVDPTCGAAMRARGPSVLDWCHRMMEPRLDGPFEGWTDLSSTMAPLLTYVGRYFLPWTTENARALAAGEESFTVDLPGGAYSQPPQKYHARSLGMLKSKFAAAADAPGLSAILSTTGCLDYLK